MAGGILGCVGVVKIGNMFIPLGGLRTAQVRPRDKGRFTTHFDLGLEDEGKVRVDFDWFAMVYEKD